jgi:lactoylglutathione lyase
MTFAARRIGTILAVADVGRGVAFYRDLLGFEVEALYEGPAYATLVRDGVRLSLAEQGHPAPDFPGHVMTVPADQARTAVVLVLEVDDALAVHAELVAKGATILAEPYSPPWGGCRFFVLDPDGYPVELEQPA